MELGKLGFDAVVHDVSAPTLYISEMKNDTKTCLCAHWSMNRLLGCFHDVSFVPCLCKPSPCVILGSRKRHKSNTASINNTMEVCQSRHTKTNEFRTQKLTNGSIHPHEHTWWLISDNWIIWPARASVCEQSIQDQPSTKKMIASSGSMATPMAICIPTWCDVEVLWDVFMWLAEEKM